MTNKKNLEYIKVILIGLIVECPLGGNPEDCLFYEHRKLPMVEKVKWVNSLTDDECQKAYVAHCECYRKNDNVAFT